MDDKVQYIQELCERERCRKPFLTRNAMQRFCSEKCRKLQEKLRAREKKKLSRLNPQDS